MRTSPKTLVSNCARIRSSGTRLDRAGLAVAGVVDERADRALGLLDRGDRRPHRILVGDVEGQRPAARARRGRRSTRCGGRSRRPSSRARARRSAVARPIPDEHPVISTDRGAPVGSCAIRDSILRADAGGHLPGARARCGSRSAPSPSPRPPTTRSSGSRRRESAAPTSTSTTAGSRSSRAS